ncbi:Flagellar basal-body rod protein FlgC [Candidatus Magnetomoraceae bacterium gMMP-15]
MNFFNALNISTTGLTVNRLQMNIISDNLSNAYTTRTSSGEPYRRKVVILEPKAVEDFDSVLKSEIAEEDKETFKGVNAKDIIEDKTPFRKVHNPGHPHADKTGFVSMPNVNVLVEMANMVVAKRSYEANVTAIGATKSMAVKALEIGK